MNPAENNNIPQILPTITSHVTSSSNPTDNNSVSQTIPTITLSHKSPDLHANTTYIKTSRAGIFAKRRWTACVHCSNWGHWLCSNSLIPRAPPHPQTPATPPPTTPTPTAAPPPPARQGHIHLAQFGTWNRAVVDCCSKPAGVSLSECHVPLLNPAPVHFAWEEASRKSLFKSYLESRGWL